LPQWFLGSHNDVSSTRKSARERLVMAEIVKGLSSKEVARELGISPRTVDFTEPTF
jgi:DNA-binding CsgD family transcriptional regulator